MSFEPSLVRLLNDRCVPVAVNSFYRGSWFHDKSFMDGMWKNVAAGNADWTVLAPDGELLDRNVGDGLAKWMQLPEAQRRPGAYAVKTVTEWPKNAPPKNPPPGILVLRSWQRNLSRRPKGDWERLTKAQVFSWVKSHDWRFASNDAFADTVWFPESEWKALIQAQPQDGERFPLPATLKKRLLVWHLVNGTICVGYPWEERDIRSENLTVVVEGVSPVLRLRIEGSVHLEMSGSPEDVKRDWHRTAHGYQPKVLGFVEFDRAKNAFTRFDLVAVGDFWGGNWEGGAFSRVGRLPLAISFELADGSEPIDRLLPHGGVFLDDYFKSNSP